MEWAVAPTHRHSKAVLILARLMDLKAHKDIQWEYRDVLTVQLEECSIPSNRMFQQKVMEADLSLLQ